MFVSRSSVTNKDGIHFDAHDVMQIDSDTSCLKKTNGKIARGELQGITRDSHLNLQMNRSFRHR